MCPEYYPALGDQTPSRPGTPVGEPTFPSTSPQVLNNPTISLDANLVSSLLQTVSQQAIQFREMSSHFLNSNSISQAKGPKYPDVPLYDGKVKEFSNFLASVELFFINMPSFSTDAQRVGYVLTRLTGTARDWATTLIQRRDVPQNALALSN